MSLRFLAFVRLSSGFSLVSYIATDVTVISPCFLSSLARCLFWYLLFWNQFLIWSSVISRPLANSVRSSRVRYCWRENILSRYWSWRWVKWLRFRLFRLEPFSLKHFTDFDSFLKSLSSIASEDQTRQKRTYVYVHPVFMYYFKICQWDLSQNDRVIIHLLSWWLA